MGGATIWPVPRALDAEAHYYPRKWKRNFLFLYGGLFLIGMQVQRFGLLHRVSTINKYISMHVLANIIFQSFCSNALCELESTWTGVVETLRSVSDLTSDEVKEDKTT